MPERLVQTLPPHRLREMASNARTRILSTKRGVMLAAAAVYVPVALLALDRGWGIRGVWVGLAGLIAVRLLTCAARFAGSRWALTGATAA